MDSKRTAKAMFTFKKHNKILKKKLLPGLEMQLSWWFGSNNALGLNPSTVKNGAVMESRNAHILLLLSALPGLQMCTSTCGFSVESEDLRLLSG